MKYSHLALLCSFFYVTSTAQANSHLSKPINYPTSTIQTTKTHFVQFFSSGNATKAEGMKNTLVLQGYPAFVFVTLPQQKQTSHTYYQVQVGPFPSRDLAKKAKTQVIQKYPEFGFLTDAILKTSL
jgi:cell division septation protein DedD